VDQVHVDEKSGIRSSESRFEGGNIEIANDVMVELAKKTIWGIPNIQLANMGIASKFGIGRKAGDGIRVSTEEGKISAVTVDAYILVKYGQRIPDVAGDVQEKVKTNLERYTGYTVLAVNVNVQGIYLEEQAGDENSQAAKETGETAAVDEPPIEPIE
jgi:uncharacterized alkaline shock family protein YloU